MNHNPSCFGTDGIRGTVGQWPITPDFVLRLGHAVGRVLRRSQDRPVALIGKDTRLSGYMLESALESGFNSAGVDVVLLGPLPTPGVAYLTRAQRASLGVVISASHNAYADNGIKFFSAQGTKLPDAWEEAVNAVLGEEPQWEGSAAIGRAQRLDDAAGRYIEFCKSTFSSRMTLRGLRIVVDAANGAAWHIAPKVFHELGAEVVAAGCSPDGLNINHGCGSQHPGTLRRMVLAEQADFGIALDGDADRVLMVDAQGTVYNGDQLLYLIARDRLAQGDEVHGVVGTQMTNMAIELAFRNLGVAFVRARVGDRHVLEELEQRGWKLGGEGSGHLLVLDRHTTGDGLVSALQVLQACVRNDRSMNSLAGDAPLFPQTLLNVRLQGEAGRWRDNAAFMRAVQEAGRELDREGGRVLVRESGTEPLLRIMVEAREATRANDCAHRLAELAQRAPQHP